MNEDRFCPGDQKKRVVVTRGWLLVRSWAEVVDGVEAELARCSQRLAEGEVLPDRLVVQLPEAVFGAWAPVLEQVAGEVGEALVAWAKGRGARWYGGRGPCLEVELVDAVQPVISVGYRGPDAEDGT